MAKKNEQQFIEVMCRRGSIGKINGKIARMMEEAGFRAPWGTREVRVIPVEIWQEIALHNAHGFSLDPGDIAEAKKYHMQPRYAERNRILIEQKEQELRRSQKKMDARLDRLKEMTEVLANKEKLGIATAQERFLVARERKLLTGE